MTKNLIISILLAFLLTAAASQAETTRPKKAKPLPDGFVLSGTYGRIIYSDSNSPEYEWAFEPDSDIISEKGHIPAGTRIALLPSAALENIIANIKDQKPYGCRLWARVTKYQDKNYIFPIYSLPLAETPKPAPQPKISPQTQEPTQQQPQLTINDPEDQLDIPDEILKKLHTPKTILPHQPLEKPLELKQDFILANRTGFIVSEPGNSKFKIQNSKFVLDSLGRNLPKLSFRLLPCQALENAQIKQAFELDPIRFKTSGIITKYKNNHYMLLQRAIRIYSHENFPK